MPAASTYIGGVCVCVWHVCVCVCVCYLGWQRHLRSKSTSELAPARRTCLLWLHVDTRLTIATCAVCNVRALSDCAGLSSQQLCMTVQFHACAAPARALHQNSVCGAATLARAVAVRQPVTGHYFGLHVLLEGSLCRQTAQTIWHHLLGSQNCHGAPTMKRSAVGVPGWRCCLLVGCWLLLSGSTSGTVICHYYHNVWSVRNMRCQLHCAICVVSYVPSRTVGRVCFPYCLLCVPASRHVLTRWLNLSTLPPVRTLVRMCA